MGTKAKITINIQELTSEIVPLRETGYRRPASSVLVFNIDCDAEHARLAL